MMSQKAMAAFLISALFIIAVAAPKVAAQGGSAVVPQTPHSKIIPRSLIDRIEQCVRDAKNASEATKLLWRTRTGYLSASPTKSVASYKVYSPCELLKSQGETPAWEYNNVAPPQIGDVVEGQLVGSSGKSPLPFCKQYRFSGGKIQHNVSGLEKFKTYVDYTTENPPNLTCTLSTAGGGSGKGGGHVYGYCESKIAIVWTQPDLQIANQICAKEILK